MIDHFDTMLRRLFVTRIPDVATDSQVRFQPPDDKWRQYVANLQNMALNVYLVDLRENRKLRSNERMRSVDQGIVLERAAATRMDCHYFITAWNPAVPSDTIDPVPQEHALLYSVAAVLSRQQPLTARSVYDPDPPPNSMPALLVDNEVPVIVLPVEGFPKYAEFWGTMAQVHPWKPAVYFIATLPIAYDQQSAGPMVTTQTTTYRQGDPIATETFLQIGGTVIDATGATAQPVVGAFVELLTTANERLQQTGASADGRFTFLNVRAGTIRLRATASELGTLARDVDVPSPNGEYDLRYV